MFDVSLRLAGAGLFASGGLHAAERTKSSAKAIADPRVPHRPSGRLLT
jgi:hypothetical protein